MVHTQHTLCYVHTLCHQIINVQSHNHCPCNGSWKVHVCICKPMTVILPSQSCLLSFLHHPHMWPFSICKIFHLLVSFNFLRPQAIAYVFAMVTAVGKCMYVYANLWARMCNYCPWPWQPYVAILNLQDFSFTCLRLFLRP